MYCSDPKKIAEPNDILISVRAPIGALNYAKTHCCIGRGLAAIRIQDPIERNFVYHFLKAKKSYLNQQGVGSTFKAIGKKVLENLLIPDVNKNVQNEAMRIIDLTESIIREKRKELCMLDELVKARFVEMFGDLANPETKWEKCKLVEACVYKDDIKCGPFGTQLSKSEYLSSWVAVWEIPQINSAFKIKPTDFITEAKAKELSSYSIISGDIAMSRKGNVGMCAIFPDEYSPGIIHSDVLRIRVNKKMVNPIFMLCQLHFSGAIRHQINIVSNGAVMAGINVTKLKDIEVYVPPLDLQQRYSEFYRQVDKSKFALINDIL